MNQSSSWLRNLRIGAQLLMTLSLLLALAAPVLQSVATPQPASAAAGTEPDPSIEPGVVELPPEGEEPPIEEPPVEEPSEILPPDEIPSEEPLPSDLPPDEEPSFAPDPVYGTLTIYLWECPAGYEMTGVEGDLAADCTVPLDGVQFDLDQDDAYGDLTQVTGEFGITGAVSFGAVGPGILNVTQYLPEGIADTISIGCAI